MNEGPPASKVGLCLQFLVARDKTECYSKATEKGILATLNFIEFALK